MSRNPPGLGPIRSVFISAVVLALLFSTARTNAQQQVAPQQTQVRVNDVVGREANTKSKLLLLRERLATFAGETFPFSKAEKETAVQKAENIGCCSDLDCLCENCDCCDTGTCECEVCDCCDAGICACDGCDCCDEGICTCDGCHEERAACCATKSPCCESGECGNKL